MLDRDRLLPPDTAVLADNNMVDDVDLIRLVANGVHFAGQRIEVRMGGKGMGECAFERVVGDR